MIEFDFDALNPAFQDLEAYIDPDPDLEEEDETYWDDDERLVIDRFEAAEYDNYPSYDQY
jgi:hypothetical protein